MRGESKSEIDFVLIEEGCVERVNRMTIYEEGELGLHQSDHNWVEVNINHTGGVRKGQEEVYKWNIRDGTDWEGYKRCIENKLSGWRGERETGHADAGDVETEYKALIQCIIEAAEETIGVSRVGKRGKKKGVNGRVKSLIKKRNQAGKEWRKELVNGGLGIQRKWENFKQRMAGVANEWRKDLRRKCRKWRVKSLDKGSANSKAIWRDLRVKSGRDDINAIQNTAGKTLVHPEEIKKEIERYMEKLGDGGQGGGGERRK